MAGDAAQLQQDLVDAAEGLLRDDGRHALPVDGLARDIQQHPRHLFHRQDVGGVAGVDGAGRHAVVFGGGGFLHHADAAAAEDGAQAQGAVGGGAGEDDADRAFGLIVGQGAQEAVDRHALAAHQFRHRELQHATEDRHLAVGRDDIDMVGCDHDLVECFEHRHGGRALQDFGEQADVARVEMRHQDEGHAAVGRAGAEEDLEGFKTPGGGADADNGEGRDRERRWRILLRDRRHPAGRFRHRIAIAVPGDTAAHNFS